MRALTSIALIFLINILLVAICIFLMEGLGRYCTSSSLEYFLSSMVIFFLLLQAYATYRLLKNRNLYSIGNYIICLLGILAIWVSLYLYIGLKIEC